MLRFDTADIAVWISGAVIVLAEAHDLLALHPVQKLVAGRERDMKILIGVVVVHIDRDIEIYAANAVDDLLEHIRIHNGIAVDAKSDKILNLCDKAVNTGAAVYGVDLFNRPRDIDQRVAGDAHNVRRMVIAVKARDHDGVRIKSDAVASDNEQGINVIFPLGRLLLRRRRRRRCRRCARLRCRSGRHGGRHRRFRCRRFLRFQTGIIGFRCC